MASLFVSGSLEDPVKAGVGLGCRVGSDPGGLGREDAGVRSENPASSPAGRLIAVASWPAVPAALPLADCHPDGWWLSATVWVAGERVERQ